MDINPNTMLEQYRNNSLKGQIDKFRQEEQKNKQSGEELKLKQAIEEFSAIFINEMFKSMRNTLSDETLIDGGFAEDVFTEMLDAEISKMGASQNSFSTLNETLYQQLKEQISK